MKRSPGCLEEVQQVPSVSSLWLVISLIAIGVSCIAAAASFNGTPAGGLAVGLLLAAALYGHWRFAASRPKLPWRTTRPRAGRRGFTLVSALTSLAILAVVMAMSVQIVSSLTRAKRVSAARAEALVNAVAALEAARAGVAISAVRPAAGGQCVWLDCTPGPVKGTRTVTACAEVDGQRIVLTTVALSDEPLARTADRGQ